MDVESSVAPLTYRGQPALQVIATDITLRKKAEAALQETTRLLAALSRRVLEAQETERRRVTRELNAENLRIVEAALQHVRRLAVALRPSVLDDLGLIPALRGIAEQTAAHGGFEVHFQPALPAGRLPPDVETACFRIVQEALTNITRHARAQRVDIDLFHDGDALVLGIHDDGCGFEVAAVRERASAGDSIGLLGMKERATLLGGQLDIESIPGMGSTVRMRCPLQLPEVTP